MNTKRHIVPVIFLLAAIALALIVSLVLYNRQRNRWQPLNSELATQLNESSRRIADGDNQGARELLEDMARVNPGSEMIPYNLGITYMNERQYEQAVKHFSRSIKMHPTMGAHLNRAWCHKMLDNNQKAIDDYSRVIAMNPDFAQAYYERGFLLMLLKRGDEARADLERAERLGLTKARTLLDQL